MQTLNPQSLIEVVNQSNSRPKDGIPGDRNSALGNPFDMQRDERLRDPVRDAYDQYFDAVLAGAEPVATATQLAKERGLSLAYAWKRPTRDAFMGALAVLKQRQAEGKPSKVMCWCAPSRCHLDTVKAYLDNQRAKSLQTTTEVFSAMPAAPTQSQPIAQSSTATGEAATVYQWSRYAPAGTTGYECSTQGDRRFSALNAKLRDGRLVEEAYQLDVKGYRAQGNNWQLGKGKPPLQPMTPEESYEQYKDLWRQWATENPQLFDELTVKARGKVLTDKFATTPISQARALAELLNERELAATKSNDAPTASPDRITSLTATQVFVFGSNTEGRHGKGAALQAMAFGAEYGNPRGRQRQTYAIVTKDLTLPKDQQHRSVPLGDIEQQVKEFLSHAIAHPEHEFLVTRFGCDLAGYSEQEIGRLWIGKDVPANVRLPQVFLNIVQATQISPAIAPKSQTTEGVEARTPTTLTVISGGQTGGDMGGLRAGKALGLETGGTAPHGWLVERCARFPNGTNPGLADYGLIEGPSGNNAGHTYILRTEMNVRNSDGTLVLGSIDPEQDKGSFRTVELAEKHGKPCLHVGVTDLFKHANESVLRIKDWVLAEGIETLNVAGNRESKCRGLEDRVETVLKVALAEVVRVRTAHAVEQQTTTNGGVLMAIDHTTPIVIACDGACSGNPGPGGYGTIVQYPDGTEEIIVGSALETTNNRMELQGLIEGLKAVYSNSEAALTFSSNPVHVLTDSDLTIKCAEGTWKRKANRDLWQEYDQLTTSRALTFEWVRGHNGHALNERCDQLAVEQSQLAKQSKVSEPTPIEQDGTAAAQSKPEPQPGVPNRYPVYLTLTNGQLQQHANWAECQAATNGVSGAKYKKVKNEVERTQTLEQWGVQVTETPPPVRYLVYADRECCPQSDSTDVQTKTSLLTQKAIKEAQKRGYSHIEVIVATLNEDPVNLECLQPLVAAAQSGVSKAQLSSASEGSASLQAEVFESTEAPLDLLDLQGNPDNRLILISNGKGLGTQQLVQQAESLGVKVIGYNPEKQEFLGAPQPQPVPVTTKAGKGTRANER